MKQSVFTVKENTPLSPRMSRLRLLGDSTAIARPGQFVSLSLPGFFLRRPFSVCDWDASGFSIVYEQVGKGTEAMRGLQRGRHFEDGVTIRRSAAENNVTIFTSLDTVRVLLDVLEETTITVSTIDA